MSSSEIQPAPETPPSKPVSSDRPAKVRGGRRNTSDSLATAAALVPALLASSCCIPQLILNAFSFGCAGFAALTPFRPFFLALTAIGVAAAAQRNGWSRRTVALALLTWAIAFSDVALRQYNTGALQSAQPFGRPLPHWAQTLLTPPQWLPQDRFLTNPPQGGAPPPGSLAAQQQQPRNATVIMTALNINCEACAARVKRGLEAKFGSHILSVQVQEKSKAVVVKLRDQAAITDQAILDTMYELKNPANIVRRDVH